MRVVGVSVSVAVLLGGCALFTRQPVHIAPPSQPPPKPVIIVKPAPVAVSPPAPPARVRSCVPKTFPRAPKYPDTDQALLDAGGAADRYQLLAAGRVLRSMRLSELERLLDGCR